MDVLKVVMHLVNLVYLVGRSVISPGLRLVDRFFQFGIAVYILVIYAAVQGFSGGFIYNANHATGEVVVGAIFQGVIDGGHIDLELWSQ